MKQILLCGLFAGMFASVGMAQSVTVGTSGADYTSLNTAIAAVGANAAAPDVITILDAGPFFENRVVVNIATSGADDLTIKAAPGIRPVIVVDMTNSSSKASAVYLRKSGNLIFRDLIIIPTATGITDQASFIAKVAEDGIQVDDDAAVATSTTLQNILVSSNNGSNAPIASLDGLTSPTFTASTVSFRDEGIETESAAVNAPRNLYMYDVVVSGVSGNLNASEGIRGFFDGNGPGSEWIIGPGCVVSYNNTTNVKVTSTTSNGAFQPGGNATLKVKVLGSQAKPVKLINNNLNGISVTNQVGKIDGLDEVRWCIVANNSGVGFKSVDTDSPIDFSNVTFVNNDDGVFHGSPDTDETVYTFSNVIFAGDGGATDPANVIELLADGAPGIFTSTFTATNSAFVLTGPYTLNNVAYGADGIASDAKWVVNKPGALSSDPQFMSLNPTSGSFAVVSNPAYGTAGPGGSALVGGGKFAPASVSDWQLF